MRELSSAEIDAVSGAEGCRLPSATLGEYLKLAIGVIITHVAEVLSGTPRDPWAS